MQLNYIAILIASVLQFIFGAIWYTPIFGGLWGKIHGFDECTPEEKTAQAKGMFPLLAVQFVMTIITTVVFALFVEGLPVWNIFGIAAFFWIGFFVPTHTSAVIFSETKPRWFVTKILVMSGASLGCLMIAAAVLHFM